MSRGKRADATIQTWLPYMPKKTCDESLGIFDRQALSKNTLRELLRLGMTSNKAMIQACIVLLELLRREGIVQKDGFYILPMSVKKWMEEEGSEVLYDDDSKVYSLPITEGGDFIVKTDKPETIIREYIIGRVMNDLREYVPNFVYTFGLFKGNSTHALFLEKVEGQSLKKSLATMTFQEFLRVFCQLLIGLEVAQRKVGFCHYDTHIDNVIIRSLPETHDYSVKFDEQNTTVKVVTDKVPVIIDYGLSCIEGDETRPEIYRSVRGIQKYGIYNTCIAGVDAYKILYSSAVRAKGDLRNAILQLFSFYTYDPYSCAKVKQKTMEENYFKEYLQKFAISRSASFTPIQFLKWILSKWSVPGIFLSRKRNAVILPPKEMTRKVLDQTIDSVNREQVEKFVSEALKKPYKGAEINQAMRWAKTLLTINTG